MLFANEMDKISQIKMNLECCKCHSLAQFRYLDFLFVSALVINHVVAVESVALRLRKDVYPALFSYFYCWTKCVNDI